MKRIFGPTNKLESDINNSGDKKQNLSVSCLRGRRRFKQNTHLVKYNLYGAKYFSELP